MSQYLYSIYDLVSKEFCSPVLLKNDDVAKRWFHTQALKGVDPSCISDLRLFVVAEFDTGTGCVKPLTLKDITDSEDSPEATKEFLEG